MISYIQRTDSDGSSINLVKIKPALSLICKTNTSKYGALSDRCIDSIISLLYIMLNFKALAEQL